MNHRQQQSYAVYCDARELVLRHSEALAPVIESGVWHEFNALIDEIQTQAVSQGTHRLGTRSGTITVAGARSTLLECHVLPILAIAATLARTIPELSKHKAPPRRATNATVDVAARALADAVSKYAEHFIRLGLEPDFVDRAHAAADALVAAVNSRGGENGMQVGATAGVDKTIQRANTHLKAIGALIRKHARGDHQLMAEWRSAKRLPAHGRRALGAGRVSKALLANPHAPALAPVDAPKALPSDGTANGTESDAESHPDYTVSELSAPRRLLAGVVRLMTSGTGG